MLSFFFDSKWKRAAGIIQLSAEDLYPGPIRGSGAGEELIISKEMAFGFCVLVAVSLTGAGQTGHSRSRLGQSDFAPSVLMSTPTVSSSSIDVRSDSKINTAPGGSGDAIYVDDATGADPNPGTQERPLKTISKAAEIAVQNYKKNESTTVIIQPGIYRESISLDVERAGANGSIMLEAAKPGTVSISGADLWTDWQPESANPSQYVHVWPYRWGACEGWRGSGSPTLPEIVRHREMVFVDGSMLIQVLSQKEMAEGSFFVDEASGRIYIWPAPGTKVAIAMIEVAIRPRLLETHNVSNLTLRGLSFVHGNGCPGVLKPPTAVSIVGGSNLLIEDSSFQWNNWAGFRLEGVSNSTVRRVVASHNGTNGLAGYQLKMVTYEDVEASYNNWRAARGKIYGWDVAGAKLFLAHNVNFIRFRAFENRTRGLWFDTDNANVSIQDSYLSRNLTNGLFLEASQGPITVKDSKICNNGAAGLVTNNSESVSLIGNLFYANQSGQIYIFGASKSRDYEDWETRERRQLVAHSWTLLRNTIVGADSNQLLFEVLESSSDSSNLFFSTLNSGSNTWFNLENKKVFQLDPGGAGHKPKDVDFVEWRSRTHQDRDSIFAPPTGDPAAACARP